MFRSHGGDGSGGVCPSEVMGNRVGGFRCAGRENQARGVESKFRCDDSAGFLEESVRTLTGAVEAGGVSVKGSQRGVEAA